MLTCSQNLLLRASPHSLWKKSWKVAAEEATGFEAMSCSDSAQGHQIHCPAGCTADAQ